MMKSILPSLNEHNYSSGAWHESRCLRNVKFSVRRPSLQQRIELTRRIRELTLENEFLRSGESPDQLAAALSDLYVQRLYVEWGLLEIRGLKIDGVAADAQLIVERGPEALVEEIALAVRGELGLSDAERKNS